LTVSDALKSLDQLLGRLDQLDIELSMQQIRVLTAVGMKGSADASELCHALGVRKQTICAVVKALAPFWSRKQGQLSMPAVPLLARTKRPGKPYQLRLSRSGRQLFEEAGLLKPSNDRAS